MSKACYDYFVEKTPKEWSEIDFLSWLNEEDLFAEEGLLIHDRWSRWHQRFHTGLDTVISRHKSKDDNNPESLRRINSAINLNKTRSTGLRDMANPLWSGPFGHVAEVVTDHTVMAGRIQDNLFSLRAWEIWPIRYGAAVLAIQLFALLISEYTFYYPNRSLRMVAVITVAETATNPQRPGAVDNSKGLSGTSQVDSSPQPKYTKKIFGSRQQSVMTITEYGGICWSPTPKRVQLEISTPPTNVTNQCQIRIINFLPCDKEDFSSDSDSEIIPVSLTNIFLETSVELERIPDQTAESDAPRTPHPQRKTTIYTMHRYKGGLHIVDILTNFTIPDNKDQTCVLDEIVEKVYSFKSRVMDYYLKLQEISWKAQKYTPSNENPLEVSPAKKNNCKTIK
ncbi:7348_t:CDS:2, partial [Paraglomus occultum]